MHHSRQEGECVGISYLVYCYGKELCTILVRRVSVVGISYLVYCYGKELCTILVRRVSV